MGDILTRLAVSIAPALLFLSSLIYLDSYKLVRFRAVVSAILVGGAVAAACYPINVYLMGRFGIELQPYSRYLAPLIEEAGKALSALTALNPDVIVVTGDHSTPAVLKGHSWHPLPTILYSQWCRPDSVDKFSETACILGGLGRLPATRIMPLAMANALKLAKFGA